MKLCQQVYTHYGELWRIEEGFRVLKHTMAIRPVFHWVERRVHAHVAICFVAFALLRILRHRYNTIFGARARVSEGQILSELSLVQACIIRDRGTNAEYLLPSKAREEAIRLYHAVVRIPNDLGQWFRLIWDTIPNDLGQWFRLIWDTIPNDLGHHSD